VARAAGSARIRAASGAAADTASVTVRQVVATLSVTPATDTLYAGHSLTLGVVAADSNGIAIPAALVDWSSSNPQVATIDGGGSLDALAAGSTTVRARFDGREATASISVVDGFVEIGGGNTFTCGLTGAGALYCWGVNGSGQHGTGDATTSLAPRRAAGGMTFRSIVVAQNHVCGIANAGGTFCFGAGTSGQLGQGVSASSSSPVAVATALAFETLAAGRFHTCAGASNVPVKVRDPQ
jgi:hypothetical protein